MNENQSIDMLRCSQTFQKIKTIKYKIIKSQVSENNDKSAKIDIMQTSTAFRKVKEIRLQIKKSLPAPTQIIQSSEVYKQSEIVHKPQQSHIKRSKSMIKLKCYICEEYRDAKQEFKPFLNCNHKIMCSDCSIDYLKMKISQRMTTISCQKPQCKGKLDENSQIYQKGLEQKIKKMHKRNIQELVLKKLPCRVIDCEGFFSKQLLKCSVCEQVYCPQCNLAQHKGKMCMEDEFINLENIKKCPTCKVLIQKNGGCNHMICPNRHQFCFVCLKNWSKVHHLCSNKPNLFRKFLKKMKQGFEYFFQFD